MIKNMKKVSLVAMRSDLDRLAKDLIWLSCVEVEKCEAPEGDAIIRSMDCGERITELNTEAATLSEALKILSPMRRDKKGFIKTRKEMSKKEFDGRAVSAATEGAGKAVALKAEAERLKGEKNKLTSYLMSVSAWQNYDLPLGFEGTKSAVVITGTLPASADIGRLSGIASEELSAVQIEIVAEGKSTRYISAVCHNSVEKQLTALLSEAGFIKSNFPSQTGTAREEMAKTEAEIRSVENREEEIKDALSALALLCPDMEHAYDRVKTELAEENVKQKLIGTGHTVIMTGWVPDDRVDKLTKTLSKYECFCDIADPEEGDEPPVELKNNGFASPFEFVIGMYSYPKYGSFDPTFWVALFFALIFGMMFADLGYGLLLVLIGALGTKLMKPKGGTAKMMKLFVICGISCMICGVLFGGYFGDLPAKLAQSFAGSHKLDNLAIVCNPLDEPITFLLISLGIGAAHLICGMIINMVMCCKRGDWQSAVFDVGSWLMMFAGAGVYFGLKSKVGLIILGVGLLMMITMRGRAKKNIFARLFSGIAGLYDIINYASDLLSYSRIFALALAGAVIASVVNTFATLVNNPVVTVILVIVVGTFGHLMNLALSALGAFVHTCRLQYVEFFGKFYEDGGRHFEPASPDLTYTDVYVEQNN